MADLAEIGIFGGSGFYSLLEDVREAKIDTPYGPPSDSFFLATVAGRRVAFLPRHGRRHTIPPHKVNYRANVWAMRSLGVKAVISPCAAGSLQLHVEPGHFVVADQFVDRTSGRADTFFDGPIVSHVSSAEIYDPTLRGIALDVIREHGITVHDGGTVVVIQGPALLHQVGEQVVQRRRVGGHQHDPVPGGLPVPGAGDGRGQHLADHGLRRRGARGHPRGDRPRRAGGVRAERRADPQGRPGHGGPLPGRPRRPGRRRGAAPHAGRRPCRRAPPTSASSRRSNPGCHDPCPPRRSPPPRSRCTAASAAARGSRSTSRCASAAIRSA